MLNHISPSIRCLLTDLHYKVNVATTILLLITDDIIFSLILTSCFDSDQKHFGTRCCWSPWSMAWMQAWHKKLLTKSTQCNARWTSSDLSDMSHWNSL